VLEVEHQNGKLGISIAGGMGSEYIQGSVHSSLHLQPSKHFCVSSFRDHGVFVTNIVNPMNKQLSIGDRLLEISSAVRFFYGSFAFVL
jgi:hypothetical protein